MSDLTDFLLTCIAEDETVAGELRAEGIKVEGGQVLREHWHEGGPYHSDRWNPARVLAECEAKRQIVKQVSVVDWAGYAVRDFVLQRLALPDADHPDYREEWRP